MTLSEDIEHLSLTCNECGAEPLDCRITCEGDFPNGYKVTHDQLWTCDCGNRHLFEAGDYILED